MFLSSREAVTPCCPCSVSLWLTPFPRDDPCDLLHVLLEFDVKGLVAKNGVLFSNKYDPLPLLGLALTPSLTLSLLHSQQNVRVNNLFLHHFTHLLSFSLSIHHSLSFLTLHQWIFLSLPLCPLVSPLISPWLSHVLFQSTGAQGGNEIWRPSLNGHAHILCNYLGLRTGAQLSIYKSVLLTGPSRLLKPYPADASWWDSDPWPFTPLGLLGVTCDPALGSLRVCSVWPLQASWPPKSQLCLICP